MKTAKYIFVMRHILNMIKGLDLKDRIILYYLDLNAKIPLSEIAKKTKLSRESVLYRINKYLSEGLIRNYLLIVNNGLLGKTMHKVFLKLSNMSVDKEKEFINSLISNPNVVWVGSCDGLYSLIYVIKSESSLKASEILDDINKNYCEYIKDQEFTTLAKGTYFPRDYLIKDLKKFDFEMKNESIWTEAKSNLNLDKIDFEILEALSNNLRTSSTIIANKTNVSPDTVINRIKKLETNDLISRYSIWIDVNKLIGQYYKVLIKLKNLSKDVSDKIEHYARTNPNIVYITKDLGYWQYEFDIEVKNSEELREIMRDFTTRFTDYISEYTALDIYQEHKYKMFDIREVNIYNNNE